MTTNVIKKYYIEGYDNEQDSVPSVTFYQDTLGEARLEALHLVNEGYARARVVSTINPEQEDYTFELDNLVNIDVLPDYENEEYQVWEGFKYRCSCESIEQAEYIVKVILFKNEVEDSLNEASRV